MSVEDWNCPLNSYYVRESICADLVGGTPADYDSKPQLYNPDIVDCSDLPAPVEDDPNTPIDETVPVILQGWVDPSVGCDMCRLCENQLHGWVNDGFPMGGWDEISACPPRDGLYDDPELQTWCENGMPSPEIWKCNGSQYVCGSMHDSFPPASNTTTCMSAALPDCVEADATSAAQRCNKLCENKNAQYQKEADDSATKTWTPWVCPAPFAVAQVMNPLLECEGGGPMPVLNALPSAGLGELVFNSSTATSDDLGALIDFDTSQCDPNDEVCEITVADIRSERQVMRGQYTTWTPEGTASALPFLVSDLQVRLLQPAHGYLNQRLGLVTFPDDEMIAFVRSGPAILNGVPISPGLSGQSLVLNSARGVWDGQQLMLDLSWRNEDLSLWVRLAGE